LNEFSSGLHDDFHDYILVWTKDQLSFYLDDHLVGQFNRPEIVSEGNWPFDKPYHLIINMAVGGNWGGPVHDADLPFQLQIHSIEVYQ
jgi:beta-glucanase (GH16 family)